jgi:hypothetical protein
MKAIKADLREALLAYRRERPHLSLRAIAKNSGCNRYFLTKLIDESDATTSIDLNQVLLLSKFISGRVSVKEAVESSGSVVKECLSKIINADYIMSREISLGINQIDLYDTFNFFILLFASYAQGVRRELVGKIFGQRGEQALKKLMIDGSIVEVEGRIRLREGNDFTLSLDVMRQRIPDYLKFHTFDNSFQQKNFIHVYSEGLSEDAVRKIYDIHARMNEEIKSVLMDKDNHGDIPVFTFSCMDRLYDSEEDEICVHEEQALH